jgi:transcriptional regulator with XRE-family HTH domain
MQLRDLTRGERLLLERRRHGESQRAAADRHGVSRYRYRRWEADEDAGPRVALERLRAYERCFLQRRREGLRLAELAHEAGLSRWWLCQMEYGAAPAGRLVRFWAAREAG